MTQPQVVFQIVDGPSREELFDSLRLYRESREVAFELGGGDFFTIVVSSIEVESGSGDSWNIGGYLRNARVPSPNAVLFCPGMRLHQFHFNTRSRRGKAIFPNLPKH